MTCRSARRRMADIFDSANASANAELHAHLEICGACAAEFAGARNALAAVAPVERVRASSDFKERTMNKLHQELNAAPAARPRLWARPIPRLAFSAGGQPTLVTRSFQSANPLDELRREVEIEVPAPACEDRPGSSQVWEVALKGAQTVGAVEVEDGQR